VIDPEKRDAAIRLATYAYRHGYSRSDDGPDTLLELADLLDRVWELLHPTANVNRLSAAVAEDSHPPPLPVVSDFAFLVDRYERLARAAHRGRGRPPKNLDLAFAYRVLADFWQEQEGRNFTNVWERNSAGILVPTSPAACFFYDAMKLIDPDRPRLCEELRELMADTVKHLPGHRQGRPNLA
jgi:hypothetical protein